ncbi:MAG: tetratricopeptide repeat protein [Methanomicrobiales archaeon]|nr:tetratricopeptide repeat protein [Methanomicrobiales archaeon]
MREVPKSKQYAIGWYNEGIAHLGIRDYEEALSFMDRALGIVPNHPDFLIGKGDVLYAMERYDEAFENFRNAIREEPENRSAWLKAGLCLLKLNKFVDALEIFEYLLKGDAYDGELWFARGVALLNLGQKEEALESFRNARRLKPDQPALWHALASLEEDHGEAIELLKRGHSIDPTNLDIMLALAGRFLVLGLTEEARLWCSRAEALYSGNRRLEEVARRCPPAI